MASTSDSAGDGSGEHEILSRIAELENRLDALEGIFSDRVIDKETAHTRAIQADAREQLTVGEERTIVVQEAPSPSTDGKAVTRIGGVVTFVKCRDEVSGGDTLAIRIADIQQNYAHAVAI